MTPITYLHVGDWFYYDSPWEIWRIVKITQKHVTATTPDYVKFEKSKGRIDPSHSFKTRRFSLKSKVIPYFFREDAEYYWKSAYMTCRDCPPLALCGCTDAFSPVYCKDMQRYWKCILAGNGYRPPRFVTEEEERFNKCKYLE